MSSRSTPAQRWMIGGVFAGVVSLLLSRVYYTFVFLPAYRESHGEPTRLVDVEGAVAYWQSAPGIGFVAATVLFWGVGVWGALRSEGEKREERRLVRLRKRSSNHRALLRAAKEAGCFSCGAVFPAETIAEWIETRVDGREDATALCPHCSNHTVLPIDGETSVTDLKKIQERWGAPENEVSQTDG